MEPLHAIYSVQQLAQISYKDYTKLDHMDFTIPDEIAVFDCFRTSLTFCKQL